MWKKVERAMSDVYDHTTFADLIEQERALQRKFVPLYTI
jgi:DNA-binding IscR family transcriptional regulator